MSRLTASAIAASALTIAAAGAALVSATPAQAAVACGTSYAYASSGGTTDPNGFYAPDMRSFVAACVNKNGGDLAHTEKGPNGQTGTFGSPGSWDATAQALGFTISSSPQVGLVAQMHVGEDATLYGDDGKPNGTLTDSELVGYVDQVFSGGQALIRTYDSSTHQVRTFRITVKRYLNLNGGQGIRNGVISTPKPGASASATATPTKSVSPKPSPTPSPIKVSAAPEPSPSIAESLGPVETITASPTTAPSDLTNKKSKTLAAKYGKAIGLGGVIVALLLGIVVVAAARRTDDTGD